MKCPICNIPLQIAERQGIEIDHCPQCRGVWLDRGELDKLIERESAFSHERQREARGFERRDDDDDDYERGDYGRRRRRGGFLGELFDFD
jgi:Zn-finger nucleic acid-binding protein